MSKKKGKRTSRAKKPQVGESPPCQGTSTAGKALNERNRIALAYMELAGDKVFQKLSEEQKLELVQEVLSIGDEVASWLVAENGTNDPRKIASTLGVKVFGVDRGRSRGSEYRREKKEIVVYRDFHEKLLREVRSAELSEHLLKFVVAHQLFHHLEQSRIGEIYKRYKFETFRVGPLVVRKQIRGLSNVAARAFTQSLLRLEISPQVFDYLTYLLLYNNK